MSVYLGDIAEDATIHFIWSSYDSDGASVTRSTDGTISVYKDNGTTQSTAGVTDTEDFDSLTGIHACTIDTSADAFYATGSNYTVVLSGSTIDSQTVNAVLAHFSIENRTAFPKADYPSNFTTLGIESDGDLTKVNTLNGHTAQTGDNYARLGAPAGASVSADVAAIKTETATILADTGELQTNQGNWVTAVGFSTHSAADVWTAVTRTLTASTNFNDPTAAAIADAVWDEVQSGHVTAGTFGLYLDTEVSGVGGGSAPTAAAVADAVWTEAIADHSGTSGSTAEQLAAAGAGGDPWATAIPGSYTSGQAGYVIATSIKGKTDLITSGSVTVSSPVATDSAVTVVQGDDYADADSRALSWSSTGWPDITGATIVMSAVDRASGDVDLSSISGSVSASGGATQTVKVELTAAQTAALTIGSETYDYDVQATLSGGSIVTLATGKMTVTKDVT